MPSQQRLEPRNICVVHNSERRERAAYCLSDIVRRQMRVMFLGHAGVAVPELRRYDAQGDAFHRK